MTNQRQRTHSTSPCLTCLLIGGFFLTLVIFFLGRMFSLALSGRSTQGVVADRLACNAGSEGNFDTGWTLKIAYTDAAGRFHRFLTGCGHPKVATVGSSIAVRYLPTEPSVADLEENLTFALWFPVLLLAFISIMVLAAVLVSREEIADFFALRQLSKMNAKSSRLL